MSNPWRPPGGGPPGGPPAPVGNPRAGQAQPGWPGKQPQQPGGYPQQPGAYPQQPGAYPQQPGAYPQQPGAYPQQPGAYPQQPGAYPQQPGGHPGMPMQQPFVMPSYEAQLAGNVKRSMWFTVFILFITTVPIGIIMLVTFVDFSSVTGDGPDGGYCEAAARCCEVVHGSSASQCGNWANSSMPVEGCKRALEGYRSAAEATRKKGCD